MSNQPWRLPSGGRIDRSREIAFSFDGAGYVGHPGDTLASALLANGVQVLGRGFKFHRPRGAYTAGAAEPNALVTLREGARREPNALATVAELYPGLVAESQNSWPSRRFDLMAVNDWFKPVFAAGFYYKTFMGPTSKAWMWFEPLIRHAAGLGAATELPDPDRYEKANLFCDVLVVGGGPAGLSAALAAGRASARVILAEQMPRLGGALLDEPADGPSEEWLGRVIGELRSLPNARLLTRTSVFGAYDHGVFGLLDRVADHLAVPGARQPRQRYLVVRAKRAVIAAGAIERGIAFANNDRPGVMLASAARAYLNRFGVLVGRHVVAFANNDGAYATAIDLVKAGAGVTMIDARSDIPASVVRRCAAGGIDLRAGHAVAAVHGRNRVTGVTLIDRTTGRAGDLPCDLVCVSGGYDPQVHLASQRGLKPVWRDDIAAFVPGLPSTLQQFAGASNGRLAMRDCVSDGFAAGREAAEACGLTTPSGDEPDLDWSDGWQGPIAPLWDVPPPRRWRSAKRFVDLQNDVSVSDIELAHREGYVSVEHLKRYTTLGMATDQGKIGNVIALALMARLRGSPIPEVGTTTYRPPYTPVTIGAMAGSETGPHFRPVRRTPMHAWHEQNGAVFIDAGLWKRPWYYPCPGENLDAAYRREAAAVRGTVGMVDVSTLGKIDVQGPDAAEFLDRIYVNGWRTLEIGKARYGVMLRDDGFVLDDGTTSRIGEHHYFMTTTTAEAAKVLAQLEFLLQTAWPELRVHVTSVTDQWAAAAISGRSSRDLLIAAGVSIDVTNQALPFMGVRAGEIGGIPVRLHRISFSGELAYEIYTAAGYAEDLWERLVAAGRPLALVLYGLEALGALRIEKGHVAGSEIDGRTTLDDLGLGAMASRKKLFVGAVLREREALRALDRPRLVGLVPVDRSRPLRSGAILQPRGGPHAGHGLGHVSATTFSPQLGHDVALGFVAGGMQRVGEIVDACCPLRGEVVPVQVTSPRFFDPEGERLHA